MNLKRREENGASYDYVLDLLITLQEQHEAGQLENGPGRRETLRLGDEGDQEIKPDMVDMNQRKTARERGRGEERSAKV